MKSYQEWIIKGAISEMSIADNVYGTLRGTVLFETKRGTAQYRYFKCIGDVAENLFNEYNEKDVVILKGYHDTERKNSTFYSVLVVESYDIIKKYGNELERTRTVNM